MANGPANKTEVLLERIRLLLNASGGGGKALATEATLLSVLNAIVASDQDIEILLVRDTVTLEVFQQITNYETGVPVVIYKDVNGVVVGPPLPNPIEYLDPSAVLQLLLTEALAQGITLDSILIDTTALVAKDFATEATLIAVDEVLDNIKIDTASIKTITDAINIKFDANLSTIASEVTLAAVDAKLAGSAKTFNFTRAIAAGNIPAGTIVGSVFNAGTTDGVFAGSTIKPGESIPIPALGKNETYGVIAYTASATAILLVQYTN